MKICHDARKLYSYIKLWVAGITPPPPPQVQVID